MTDKIAGIVLLIICAPFLLVAAFGVAVFFCAAWKTAWDLMIGLIVQPLWEVIKNAIRNK